MTATYPGWTHSTNIHAKESPAKDAFDKDFYESTIEPLEQLYEKLRASKWRRWYGRYILFSF
jgi:hypothetical protein